MLLCNVIAEASSIVVSPLHLVESVQFEVPFLHVPANPLHLCLQLLTDQLQLLSLPTLSQQLLDRKGVNSGMILFGQTSTTKNHPTTNSSMPSNFHDREGVNTRL